MTQVNSEAGKSQPFGTKAVPPSPPYVPSQTARATATANTVAYTQSEPGKVRDKGRDPDRV